MIQSALSPLSLSEDEQGMAFGVVEKDWCPFGDLRANFCETTSGDCSCLPGTFLINHVFSWTRDLRIYVSLRPPTLRARLPYEVRDATVVSAARDDPTLAWYALTETGGSTVLVRCPSDDGGGGGSGVANCGFQLSIKMCLQNYFQRSPLPCGNRGHRDKAMQDQLSSGPKPLDQIGLRPPAPSSSSSSSSSSRPRLLQS